METLVFLVDEGASEDDVVAITEEAKRAGIPVTVERRDGGPQASVWLYVPTVVAILVAKSFLEALAKKAGEEFYPHLKNVFGRIVKLLAARKVFIVGKQPDEDTKRYSLTVSFYFQMDKDRSAKFLIRNDIPDAAYQECVDGMCDLLIEHVNCGTGRLVEIAARRPSKRLLLLDFDFDSHKWDSYRDPRTGE